MPCGIDNTGGTDADDLITRYGRYVDEGAATALIGAGMSRRVGYPGWVTLLEPMRDELGIDDTADMPQLAQYFVDASPDGRARLDQHVIDEFNAIGDPDPALAHRLLAQLPIDELWTTNFDPLLERSIGDAHVFAKDAELASAHVEHGGRGVNKMHGSVDPPAVRGHPAAVAAGIEGVAPVVRAPGPVSSGRGEHQPSGPTSARRRSTMGASSAPVGVRAGYMVVRRRARHPNIGRSFA